MPGGNILLAVAATGVALFTAFGYYRSRQFRPPFLHDLSVYG